MEIGKDKYYHFGVCLIISLFSPMMAIGAALAKEYGDKKAIGNHWCWWDLLADGIGILVGGTIHCLILWAVCRNL